MAAGVRNVQLKKPVGGCQRSDGSHSHGAVEVGGQTIALDAEAADEMAHYLRRRRRHVRVNLHRVRGKKDRWHAKVMCAGGAVTRSLGTTDKQLAKETARKILPRLARRARAKDSGVLFPTSYHGSVAIAPSQLRLWINEAIGRRAKPETRRQCAEMQPLRRSVQRRSRSTPNASRRAQNRPG